MTEAEWLACTDPTPMLGFVRFLMRTNYQRVQHGEAFPDCKGSDRKLRLFACECYHRIRHLLPDPRAQAAVEVAEQVADGILPADELQRAEANLREPFDALDGRLRASRGAERTALLPTHAALAVGLIILKPEAWKAAFYYASSNAYRVFAALANPGTANHDTSVLASEGSEERAQTDLLRDIFGNPFRSVSADPRWLTPTAVALARAIYEERSFDRLPILADALEEAGCDDAELLTHCRGDGPHVRGCWAVDLVLGKE